MIRVLGVSASLRNARYGRGSEQLCAELRALPDRAALGEYLSTQVKARVDDFLTAGRQTGLSFDEIYRNLRRVGNDRGLSNSEAALAAGLWGALQEGAEIDHAGLARHFPSSGRARGVDALREKILASDAILLSGPVYFGDRGSVAQAFIEFLREDPECAAHIRDRVYGGIAVGAKRNGGQETTLIYQLVDLTNLNMLAVGNDSETTSQYGGTAVAGDVGSLATDKEGIATSIGTGRRIAAVARLMSLGRAVPRTSIPRIAMWLLQDHGGRGRLLLEQFTNDIGAEGVEARFELRDFSHEDIRRCLACDVCPTHVGPREEYRCIISTEDDMFMRRHNELLGADGILLCAYSSVMRPAAHATYQRFIERTRYLRRDDYVFANTLTAPFVVSEVDSNQNLHLRMLTSFVRQLTVLHHPVIGIEFEGRVLNWHTVVKQGVSFVKNAALLAMGRNAEAAGGVSAEHLYQPVGYGISSAKVEHDRAAGRTRAAAETGERST